MAALRALRALRFACVTAAALSLAALHATDAFPGRAGAASPASLWCPDLEGGLDLLDPVLQRVVKDGPYVYGDSGVPENTPPPWMDRKRFAAGRLLTQKYALGVAYAHIQALYLVMAVPSVLDVLVYTGNSDTPDEAWDRYYDTIAGVGSWYATDMYEPGSWGYEQLKRVRGLHRMVRKDMTEREDQDDVRNRTRLGGTFSGCPASAAVRRDLEKVASAASAACPFRKQRRAPAGLDNNIDSRPERPSMWMSQYDMAMTQWSFVSPVILFAEKFGMGNATDELLDGFVHLWETIGYSLGIHDDFNMCRGGLNATRLRARQALTSIVVPELRLARPPWEYMTRCMADGLAYFIPGADFNVQLEFMLRDTLGAAVPSVSALLRPLQRESAQGLRGIMQTLREDRDNVYWGPVGATSSYILKNIRAIPKGIIKRARHRNPHRSKDCFAEIRT